MPKRSAVIRSDITPLKKEIFSRVRTTLADCHVACKVVIRVDTYTRKQVLSQ